MQQTPNPIWKWLTILLTIMPLLHMWAHFAWQIGIVVHRVHREVRPLMPPCSTKRLIVSPSTMKSSQQGASFLLSSTLDFLCPSTKVCIVFSSSVLSFSFGEQPSGVARTCIGLGTSRALLASISFSCVPHLALEFLFSNPWLLGAALNSDEVYLPPNSF